MICVAKTLNQILVAGALVGALTFGAGCNDDHRLTRTNQNGAPASQASASQTLEEVTSVNFGKPGEKLALYCTMSTPAWIVEETEELGNFYEWSKKIIYPKTSAETKIICADLNKRIKYTSADNDYLFALEQLSAIKHAILRWPSKEKSQAELQVTGTAKYMISELITGVIAELSGTKIKLDSDGWISDETIRESREANQHNFQLINEVRSRYEVSSVSVNPSRNFEKIIFYLTTTDWSHGNDHKRASDSKITTAVKRINLCANVLSYELSWIYHGNYQRAQSDIAGKLITHISDRAFDLEKDGMTLAAMDVFDGAAILLNKYHILIHQNPSANKTLNLLLKATATPEDDYRAKLYQEFRANLKEKGIVSKEGRIL